uniref:50S ribosomal protein L19 n=1 Tax=Choreocolax polysiphoniae TaxID=282351 RepID=A0A0B5W382_9FLOR|nr:50S ribosomal protein L19 [Choreocolax polysiphoniae]AJH65845.1 50S ribosomal protein L19 [Choreocolax polysiphoniae]
MMKKKNIFLNLIKIFEKKNMRINLFNIKVGDSIKIKRIIQEGDKKRIQISDGIIISKNNTQLNTTITLRKIIYNIGIERIYFLYSPQIINIEIIRRLKIKKSKLYYLRTKLNNLNKLK